jgi:hypothetical protein
MGKSDGRRESEGGNKWKTRELVIPCSVRWSLQERKQQYRTSLVTKGDLCDVSGIKI